MTGSVQIGTCGFNGSQAAYAERFTCVEVQQTFYQPPQLTTLGRWRAAMPADFEFVLKAWQLITHTAKSPTYKRLTRSLSEAEQATAGSFRPSSIVDEAWRVTLACAQTLRASTILFQCPASFTPTAEHIANLVAFFSQIERSGLTLGWEPRGHWGKELVGSLCRDLELWHVVDPFTTSTATPEQGYFRLHGRQGWRYTYEPAELADLIELLPADKPGYVFFNNINMTQDALLFKKMLAETSQRDE